MSTTRISDKYQVVIPKPVREKLRLKEGQTLHAYVVGQGVLLTPVKKWPEAYLGSQKDIWRNIDVRQFIEDERNAWQPLS